MGNRVYEQIDATEAVGAGAESFSLIFTSTDEQPRKLIRIKSNNATALVDILVRDERETICDAPVDSLPLTDNWLVFDREIKVGNQLNVGIRNATGGGVTVAILVESEILP